MDRHVLVRTTDMPGHFIANPWLEFVRMAFTLIILVAIIYGLYRIALLFAHSSNTATTNTPSSPLETAQDRYARGDITKEQFAEIKKELAAK